ncbi:UNVERIFIED_CONTAM: hypothetical protein K2H54_020182 [Gekko kuhli]
MRNQMMENTKGTADLKESKEEERTCEINERKEKQHSLGQELPNTQADKMISTLPQQNTLEEKDGEVSEKRPMVLEKYWDMEKILGS